VKAWSKLPEIFLVIINYVLCDVSSDIVEQGKNSHLKGKGKGKRVFV